MADLTDLELIARIEQEEQVAYGINDQELSAQRARALRFYLGEPFGNEVEGRSQVVSFDVQDTVESALPNLLKIFTSGDQIVRFDPKNPDDEPAAQQETDYINHLVLEKNNGFEVFYNWFKDALVSKNGYVKAYYEKYEDAEEETYEGVTDGQLQTLAQGEGVEILTHEAYPDPDVMRQMQGANAAQMMQAGAPILPPPMLHNVKIRVTEYRGCIKIKNVAPESIMVSVDTPGLCLYDSRFVQHRERTTKDELREQGFTIPENADYPGQDLGQQESNARDLYAEQFDRVSDVDDNILVRDTYLRINGKRMRYVVVGNTIVHREETECVPFACISPMLMPHRHIGRSYADLTEDIQVIKSAILRGQLDNMYLMLNGRYGISDRVNLEDMLTSRPGGVIRVQGVPAEHIMPVVHPPLPQQSFSLIEYLDSAKEKRTGVTAYNQGLDADSLNKTATGINAIMQAAAARLELVARVFAETGVKELFLLVHRLVRMNYTKPDIVRLRGKWVEVDPRAWKNRSDMTIAVGLGTGNKDAQLMHIQTILAAQQPAMALGLASPQNIYNALIKLTQNAGFKTPEEFWTDPGDKPPPPPPPDPKVQVAQMQLTADQQKFQAEQVADQQRFQAEAVLARQEAEQKARLEQQTMERQATVEQQRSQNDMVLEREKLQMQAELEKYKADLKAQTDIKIAMINAQIQAEQIANQPRPGATQ